MFKQRIALCPPTSLFLCYGLYAVLCHVTGVLFATVWIRESLATLPLLYTLPWLECSLVSLVIVLTGGLLIELTAREFPTK